MRILSPFSLLRFSLYLAVAVPSAAAVVGERSKHATSRDHLADIVTQILKSTEAHNSGSLPLATIYKATENGHAASLAMMTSWHTIVKAERPSMLAIDTKQGSAYLITDISEGNSEMEGILRGRVKVVDENITELELFINRSRGDDGYAFSAAELADNYKVLMSPPKNRKKASRATLEAVGAAAWDSSNNLSVTVTPAIHRSGRDNHRHWDIRKRFLVSTHLHLVIDEELGLIVTNGLTQGKVYPYYGDISTFIPDSMSSNQKLQEVWYEEVKKQGNVTLVVPTEATGENLEVLQFYDDELQALQFHVFLTGPNMTSSWV
ncbi:hypothetical protein N7462_006618 [Penicillium macrosclerotiorum]|uniref:uncharacterized protein n=1 Tax=Penicillium macrosclerotiorum TaxID=303699 RepID=UPI0025483917|nr:uncharacterized protein N7462_006618 [Penicillium macrosclerotiorum]KAJ5683453.1 hypothetical protein N7462_006618 [Penicillium macrosclerotiorum]